MKVSTQSLQETLGSLVDGGVQLATESDVVAGVQPYVVAAPSKKWRRCWPMPIVRD